MKKTALIQLMILFMTSFSSCQNKTLTIQKIWDKYLQTLGNSEAIQSIKTIVSTKEYVTNNGTTISNIKIKYPDKVYQELVFPNNSKVVYILNNDKGIMKTQDSIWQLSEKDIKRLKLIGLIVPEYYYKKMGYEIKLIGEEQIGLRDFYKIQVDTDYEFITLFIDKSTFELFKINGLNSETEILETTIIDGIKFIKRVKTTSGQLISEGKMKECLLNTEIDDLIFKLE